MDTPPTEIYPYCHTLSLHDALPISRGNGTTVVRLRHGASLNDFADKIDANPAALVTVLFHLGEMATATQSLDEDTFGTLRSEEHTSELQSLMRISYAVFCLKKNKSLIRYATKYSTKLEYIIS